MSGNDVSQATMCVRQRCVSGNDVSQATMYLRQRCDSDTTMCLRQRCVSGNNVSGKPASRLVYTEHLNALGAMRDNGDVPFSEDAIHTSLCQSNTVASLLYL